MASIIHTKWVLLVLVATAMIIIFVLFRPHTDGNKVVDIRTLNKFTEQRVVPGVIAPTTSNIRTTEETRYLLYGEGNYDMYDEMLLNEIRSLMSRPTDKPRQLTNAQAAEHSQIGQSPVIDKLLNGRRNGFFVECGAANGEHLSNTLFFELQRNWTGLLIEGNSGFYRALLGKNRRAYVLRACLGTERKPATEMMTIADVASGIASKMHPEVVKEFGLEKHPKVEVRCFPFNSIMAAIGVNRIDFMSLDVEGPELEILQTVDWTRLRIDVLMMEYGKKVWKLNKLRALFNATGLYKEVGVMPQDAGDAGGMDVIFQRI